MPVTVPGFWAVRCIELWRSVLIPWVLDGSGRFAALSRGVLPRPPGSGLFRSFSASKLTCFRSSERFQGLIRAVSRHNPRSPFALRAPSPPKPPRTLVPELVRFRNAVKPPRTPRHGSVRPRNRPEQGIPCPSSRRLAYLSLRIRFLAPALLPDAALLRAPRPASRARRPCPRALLPRDYPGRRIARSARSGYHGRHG